MFSNTSNHIFPKIDILLVLLFVASTIIYAATLIPTFMSCDEQRMAGFSTYRSDALSLVNHMNFSSYEVNTPDRNVKTCPKVTTEVVYLSKLSTVPPPNSPMQSISRKLPSLNEYPTNEISFSLNGMRSNLKNDFLSKFDPVVNLLLRMKIKLTSANIMTSTNFLFKSKSTLTCMMIIKIANDGFAVFQESVLLNCNDKEFSSFSTSNESLPFMQNLCITQQFFRNVMLQQKPRSTSTILLSALVFTRSISSLISGTLLLALLPPDVVAAEPYFSLSAPKQCGSTQALFHLELKTNNYPSKTSWELIDPNTSEILHSRKEGEYIKGNVIYDEILCIPRGPCYQIKIYNSFGDVITSPGYYKIFYEDDLIKENGGSSLSGDISVFFGDSCSTPLTSFAANHSASSGPLSSPSLPNSSIQTTTSHSPASSPVNRFAFISIDDFGRRYFPKFPIFSDTSYSYQQLPNCTSAADTPGCVLIPRSRTHDPPQWAGKIHATPPSCNKTMKQCDQGIPVSMNKLHSLSENLKSIHALSGLDPTNLPGVSTHTQSIAVADVTGDGMVDIIIGNKGQKNKLLLNSGDGGYSKVVNLPEGIWGNAWDTFSIAVADVNGNGMLDIIVGNWDQKNKLLLNDGDGGYSEVVDLPGGSMHTQSIAVADVNGDGMVDIIVGNENQKNQMLLNGGDGSFLEATDLPGITIDVKLTRSIAVADVNNDGMVDIIIGNFSRKNQLLMNDGGGGFSAASYLPGGDMNTYSIAAADVNGDGMVDIIIGNWHEKNQLLLNDGDGSYTEAVELLGGGMKTTSIAAADVDSNGMVDIIIGNQGQRNQLLLNDGNGNYSSVIALSGNGMDTLSIAAADVNNDGMVDIIVGNEGQDHQLLLNDAKGTYYEAADMPGDATDTVAIALADVNSDGTVDIIMGNHNSKQNNQLLLNEGDNSYSEIIDLPGSLRQTRSLVAADVNSDGMVDIIIGNAGDYGQKNQLLLNDGGSFSEAVNLPGGNMKTDCIAAADVNNDNMVDIIVGNRGQNNQLLMNDGHGSYSEAIVLPGGDMFTRSIVVADVNNDGMVDIIIGNGYRKNQLLMNDGDGGYSQAIDLPGGDMDTESIAVADVNSDGMVDIIVGNYGQKNELLLNDGNGDFSKTLDPLPGGDMDTRSIVVADVNDDGMVDIIIGNEGQNNQLLLNESGGSYKVVLVLPGSITQTTAIGAADVNDDGMLDIVVGNSREQPNQVILYDFCPNGGAKLHSRSWCFHCPSFMGRDRSLAGMKNYMCRECMPDCIQQVGNSELCEPSLSCPFGKRNFSEDSCSDCSNGTYFNSRISRHVNNPSTWIPQRCVLCPNGTYASDKVAAIDECFSCIPGTYQPDTGKSYCLDCPSGSFQPDFGKDQCKPCSKGGYCDSTKKVDGGFTACPQGTYNDKVGQSNVTSCVGCPPGTYSTENGAESNSTCKSCPSGTYNNQFGQTSCRGCEEGTFQMQGGQTSCIACPSGTYADKTGFEECITCPYRLSSTIGSATCPFCDKGFYLNDISREINNSEIFQNPFTYCLDCPPNRSSCQANTTLNNLDVQPGYWRHSSKTSTIYPCNNVSDICRGSKETTKRRKIMKDGDFGNIYCKLGHKGPLCEVCDDRDFFFSDSDGQCMKCPTSDDFSIFFIFMILGAIAVISLVLFLVAKYILSRCSITLEADVKRLMSFCQSLVSSLNLQAKVKLLVSFYQITASLEDVYGVRFHSSLWRWMNLNSLLSLDFLHIIPIPVGCMTSTTWRQIVLGATWPFMILLVGAIALLACRVYWNMKNHQSADGNHAEQNSSKLLNWAVQGTIILFYFAIPTVSRSIFDAIKCQSFDDDDLGGSVSYLLVNMEIICNRFIDGGYASIFTIFWVLFAIWIVLIPLGFFLLLAYIHDDVKSQRIQPLANSCRFLWNDYNPSVIYWDVLDTLRKISLTGLIMLVDLEEGSKKMLRLVIAVVLSVLYFGLLLAFRPYKRRGDYNLAFLSNFLLISCFSLGIILKLCDEEEVPPSGANNNEPQSFCSALIGDSFNSYEASLLVVILMLSMLFVTIGFIVINSLMKIRASTVYMRSTGHAPILELPERCTFHAFMSHKWATGQAQTHAIVRKMQLFMPGLNVWLDVDQLEDMNQLERDVDLSAVFMIFYSKGYFKSENCRRELYAAIKFGKSIVVLYKGNSSVLDEIAQECILSCNDIGSPGSDLILQRLFNNDQFNLQMIPSLPSPSSRYGPIQWLDEASFSAAALGLIYYRILINLPHYKDNSNIELLNDIVVPGTIMNSVRLQAPVNILVCTSNQGSLEVTEDLKLLMPEEMSHMISIYDNAAMFLEIDDIEDSSPEDAGGSDDGENSLISQPKTFDRPTFLLLYLNEDTFGSSDVQQKELVSIIEFCIDNPNINVILVHEQDISKGGCRFHEFFKDAPQELIKGPHNLFQDIAIPLYSMAQYRSVSLNLILKKMNDIMVKEEKVTQNERAASCCFCKRKGINKIRAQWRL